MNCDETRRLLHGFVDREVGLESSLAIEAHLEACGACRALGEELAESSRAARSRASYHAAPARLRSRIRELLPARDFGAAKARRALLAAAFAGIAVAAGWFAGRELAPPPAAPEQVVYHLTTSENARIALRNLANHIEASPGARLVVVAHNNGVEFLLDGAKDRDGAFRPEVARLRRMGVDFRICGNTLALRGIAKSRVIPEADLVPSGIAEISRLQTREGFAYLRL